MQAPILVRRYGINDRFRVNKMMIHSSHIDVLVQDSSNSIANALELLPSCAKPSMYAVSITNVAYDSRIVVLRLYNGPVTHIIQGCSTCTAVIMSGSTFNPVAPCTVIVRICENNYDYWDIMWLGRVLVTRSNIKNCFPVPLGILTLKKSVILIMATDKLERYYLGYAQLFAFCFGVIIAYGLRIWWRNCCCTNHRCVLYSTKSFYCSYMAKP